MREEGEREGRRKRGEKEKGVRMNEEGRRPPCLH